MSIENQLDIREGENATLFLKKGSMLHIEGRVVVTNDPSSTCTERSYAGIQILGVQGNAVYVEFAKPRDGYGKTSVMGRIPLNRIEKIDYSPN